MSKNSSPIPESFQIKSEIHHDTYLVHGELRKWKGETSGVVSTISSTSDYAPTALGTVPELGEAEALEALDSALEAYGRGQGVWPTMKVKDRIGCMEGFV